MRKQVVFCSLVVGLMMLCSCQSNTPIVSNSSALLLEKVRQVKDLGEVSTMRLSKRQDSLSTIIQQHEYLAKLSDTSLVNIENISSNFVLDMKYATADNFLKSRVYPCASCYVRGGVAKALVKVNKELSTLGYALQLYDCYRPHSVQKKMWKIAPDPGYVANPKSGSIHNKGAAVDVTLVQLNGTAVDMGTPFDHFGKEAHHGFRNLPKSVLKHRKTLRKMMEKHGFASIRTEWWHYNFRKAAHQFPIADFVWQCE